MEPILDGLRVVELAGDPAGEMLGKLLAGLGCDVVKVEPPQGSPTRAIGPFAGDRDDPDHSLTFWYYNTNKRSVVLDDAEQRIGPSCSPCSPTPTCASPRWRPPEARRRDLEAATLAGASERLVVVSITPFGLDGPWADRLSSDLVGLALGSPLEQLRLRRPLDPADPSGRRPGATSRRRASP